MPKYLGRNTYLNSEDSHKDLLDDRGVESVEHYLTFILNNENYSMDYPTYEYVWKKGDRLFKVAYEYYGEMKYWFIIALWNNKPTDAHFKAGDVIEIPSSPQKIYADLVN